ncbi:MAG: hypothetical protein K2X63_05755 [Burkholderiaceae bacterium]|nr:hypothetical protein [Burkholderiaceae bacterium]
MTNEQKLVDINSFDTVSDCEVAHEMELLQPDLMTGTGIFLMVLGAHADCVAAHFKANTKKYIAGSKVAEKQNKEAEFSERLIDNSLQNEVDGAAIRVNGWRNVTQPFSQDTLKAALKRNPQWIAQINKFSDSIGNFTKKQ